MMDLNAPDRGSEFRERMTHILMLLDSTAEDMAQKIERIKSGGDADLDKAAKTVAELRKWAQLAYEERNRIDKLLRDYADGNPEHAIDFAEARAQIGRRLDRLRAASGAGEVPC
jgi:hypothetical protein